MSDTCTRCPLLVSKRSRIVGGYGPEHADIMIVGPGPGPAGNTKGRPFAGRDGRVLRVLLWAAGIDQREVYLTNATRCWGGRAPRKAEIQNCHEHLVNEVNLVQPKVVIALGNHALHSLYSFDTGVKSVAGFTLYADDLPNVPIVPTVEPSYIMRGHWSEVALVLAHLRKARRIAEGDWDEAGLGSYMGITTLEQLRGLRDYLLSDEVDMIVVDTETTGLQWLDDELLCISLSGEKGIGYSVPILHRGTETVKVMKGRGKNKKEVEEEVYVPVPFWDLDTEMPEVIDILDTILRSDKPKAGQNIGFDLRMLERKPSEIAVKAQTAFGFYVKNIVHDTAMLSRTLQETLPANLTVLTAYWTSVPYYEEEVKDKKPCMWEVPDEDLWWYGGADVDIPQRVIPELLPKTQAEGSDWVYHNIGMPLIRCATRLEERGVLVDIPYFDKLCSYYAHEYNEEKGKLDELAGYDVKSPSYWENVQRVLFKERGLPLTAKPVPSAAKGEKKCKKCTRTEPCSIAHASTGTDELKELATRVDDPILPIYIRVKQIDKFRGTYLDGGTGGFKRHIRADNRLHPKWNASRAGTGRFTCENPNVMNPPKLVEVNAPEYDIIEYDAIRRMFVAPDGMVVMNVDWSQLEVWVLAYETQDPTLLGLLRNGKDVHVYVARKLCELNVSRVFPHTSWEPEIDDEEWKVKYSDLRSKAKPFTFGMSYGLTEMGAAAQLGCTVDESGVLFKAFFSQVFPTLPDYFLRIKQEVMQYHGVQNRFGRWRHFAEVPVLAALGYNTDLESVIRIASNFPIQSGGHDLHSIAHIRQEKDDLLQHGRPVLEMHDSLMMEADADRIIESAHIVKEAWEERAQNLVLPNGEPLNWDLKVEVQWGLSFGTPENILTATGTVQEA